MANQALIQAVREANPRFSEAGNAFTSAFQGGIDQFNKTKKELDEANAKADEAKANLIKQLSSININEKGLPAAFAKKAVELTADMKGDLANKAVNSNPYSLENQLNISDASETVNDIQRLGLGVADALGELAENVDQLSDVNDEEEYNNLSRYGNLTPAFDKDNKVILVDKDNNPVAVEEVINYGKRVIEIPFTIYKDIAESTGKLIRTEESFAAIKPELEQKIINALNDPDDGINFIFDSLGGKFSPYNRKDPAGGARLAKYQGLKRKNIEDVARKALGENASDKQVLDYLKGEVLNGYMGAFESVHSVTHRDTKEATQAEINKAEEAQTAEGIIDNVFSDFSEGAGKGNLDFLTGKGISYKGKTIKSIETKASSRDSKGNFKPATANFVYDADGGKTEMAFDVALTPGVISDLLSSYAKNKYGGLDAKANLELIERIKKAYAEGLIIPGDPYAGFTKQQ
jgi:hypothetical protein